MENTHNKEEAVEWVITDNVAIKFVGTNEEVQEYLRKQYSMDEYDEPRQDSENVYSISVDIGPYHQGATARRWQDVECIKP